MSATHERILTLNDPHAMRINRELAEEIGFQESVVFLQLEFLQSTSSLERDGRTWIRMSLKDLKEEHFPWWSATTLSRILNRLEERNLIVFGNFNYEAHDRTQWFSIDLEGARELRSVAIFQNEKSMSPNCKMDVAKMKNVYIDKETYSKESKERPTNVGPKKADPLSPPSPTKQIKRLSDEEAERHFGELCDSDPNGDLLRSMAVLLAEENKTGKVKVTRVWREIGELYQSLREREEASDEAWRFGLEEALKNAAPNVRYAFKAAKSFRPDRQKNGVKRRRFSGEDYHKASDDASGGGFVSLKEVY